MRGLRAVKKRKKFFIVAVSKDSVLEKRKMVFSEKTFWMAESAIYNFPHLTIWTDTKNNFNIIYNFNSTESFASINSNESFVTMNQSVF
jgi:hypothetical protein